MKRVAVLIAAKLMKIQPGFTVYRLDGPALPARHKKPLLSFAAQDEPNCDKYSRVRTLLSSTAG
jgi:hypothetical protein